MIGRAAALLAVALLSAGARAAELPDTLEQVRPAIVGIGTFLPTRRPPAELRGTGFALDDGSLVATNAHVLPEKLDEAALEKLVVFVGRGRQPQLRDARVVARDEIHDLALLKIDGPALTALPLADDGDVREGQPIAFTGFPIGAVLGLYPVTHRGIVSAITPIVIPARSSRELSAAHVRTLRDPYDVLQLDATAYPGNSGSPVYRPDDGRVAGIINQVLVKGTKESVLSDPSAITYAIPVRFLRELLDSAR